MRVPLGMLGFASLVAVSACAEEIARGIPSTRDAAVDSLRGDAVTRDVEVDGAESGPVDARSGADTSDATRDGADAATPTDAAMDAADARADAPNDVAVVDARDAGTDSPMDVGRDSTVDTGADVMPFGSDAGSGVVGFDPATWGLMGSVPATYGGGSTGPRLAYVTPFRTAFSFGVGFGRDDEDFIVRPSDGALVLVDRTIGARRILIHRAESWSYIPTTSRVSYPDDPAANDIAVPTVCPDPYHVYVTPDTSEILYGCTLCSASGGYRDCSFHQEDGTEIAIPDGYFLEGAGYGGHLLLQRSSGSISFYVRTPAGLLVASTVGLRPSTRVAAIRATPTSFLMVSNGDTAAELFEIAFDGTTTNLGSYPSAGTARNCMIQSSTRDLYCVNGSDLRGGVDRHVLGGTTAISIVRFTDAAPFYGSYGGWGIFSGP